MEPFENNSSNRELVLELLQAFNAFKQKLEDPNYIQLEMAIKQMMENQKEMKDDITELKRQLLNPYDGVIVETQRNSDHRREVAAMEAERLKMMEEHKSLVRWKANFQKVTVAVLTSAGAVIAWVLSEFVFKK
jgi:hypothetical protein